MKEITLVFPHQLFRSHPALAKNRQVYLVEEWLYFSQYHFHKQKLILHRASMKYYSAYLKEKGFSIQYIEATDPLHKVQHLIEVLGNKGIGTIHYADTTDNWLEKRIQKQATVSGIRLIQYPTPSFLNTMPDVNQFFNNRKKYFQTDFYIWQRKTRNILINKDGSPTGGKWSFDAENREKFPKKETLPTYHFSAPDEYTKEASAYTVKHFSHHYGQLAPPANGKYPWAWTFEGAEDLLDDFLENRLMKFGVYEDAMVENEHYLFHSILTPMLNTGLLTPEIVLEKTMAISVKKKIPLNSLEGFIRQIMGWREFIRIVYEREGSFQRTRNYWNFKRKIPVTFWRGQTGIGPIDSVIKKLLATGYSHHIERLMVLGNFFLLCEFDPDEVYRWFMEMYIDSYDWVMVPNVYGMTQFADGGFMTTKPYISGSNYLLKMGNWEKTIVPQTGKTWMETWDALFWRFMHVHRDFFLSNPRSGMLVFTFDKMAPEKKSSHLKTAEEFLLLLDDKIIKHM
jgi:deoxyribodipyrimidine photolyase-related protein